MPTIELLIMIQNNIGLEYGIHKLSFGTRFTYYGKTTILGYGEDGLGINPTVHQNC